MSGQMLRQTNHKGAGTSLTVKERIAAEFGLSLDRVSDALLRKIADDPTFTYHLNICRSDPFMLDILVAEAEREAALTHQVDVSDVQVMTKVAVALARWAVSGFDRVDLDEYQRRVAICSSCEHLSEAPDSLVYKLMPGGSGGKSICGLCGCNVRRKAWLSTESCPDGAAGEGGRWLLSQ